MKHRLIFFATLCFLSSRLIPTHSSAELIPSANTSPVLQIFNTSRESSITSAPHYLPKISYSRKEKDIIRKEAKKFQSKILKTFTEPQLRRATDLCLALDWKDEAIRYLQKLEKVTKNTTVVKNVKLEIADITFLKGDLKDAGKLYDEYSSLYPGDKEKAAYAQYKGILSNYYCMLTNDRDQTRTLKTISLADSFLECKSSLFKKYAADVRSIKNNCFTHLYEHESNIFEFYFKKGSYKAAKTRLASMHTNLLPHLPQIEAPLLQYEYRIAQAEKDTPRALKIASDIATRFPQQTTRIAQQVAPIRNYVDRF